MSEVGGEMVVDANKIDAEKAGDKDQPTRREFIYIATGAAAAVGVAAMAWPFISQMEPDASVQALASVEVDLSSIEPGQLITIKWRGKPVFIRHRTSEEISAIKEVAVDDLIDPVARNDNVPEAALATAANRSASKDDKWLVVVGICTHLGCVPIALEEGVNGWHCPCHGSLYDNEGRVTKGPAPENLYIPKISFVNEKTIKIG